MKHKQIIRLFALAAALSLTVTARAEQLLVPVGRVVGLRIQNGTVTVAEFDEALGASARKAGLQVGDEILQVDGREIDSVEALRTALSRSDGRTELTLRRKDRKFTLRLSPAVTADGPKLGVLVREGVTGIGTVTYYDPAEGRFGALGHGVSDPHGTVCQGGSGMLYPAKIVGIRRGLAGYPGQLRGAVSGGEQLGILEKNTPCGVFGQCGPWQGEAIPVAPPEEIRVGPARILANIRGDTVEAYAVEIRRKNTAPQSRGRDLLLEITDPRLLEATGGIVAGMSGSPILQDGRLVGAVTHVLVNDPTKGFGIFMENMLEAAS